MSRSALPLLLQANMDYELWMMSRFYTKFQHGLWLMFVMVLLKTPILEYASKTLPYAPIIHILWTNFYLKK